MLHVHILSECKFISNSKVYRVHSLAKESNKHTVHVCFYIYDSGIYFKLFAPMALLSKVLDRYLKYVHSTCFFLSVW